MQQVRREKIFETNSSSTHSISIVGGVYTPDKFPLEGGVCKVYPGEFGWDEDTFHSPAMKASYCLVFIKTILANDDRANQMFIDVLKEQTHCESVEFVSDSKDFYGWGYIDHQSDDVCGPAFSSKETLRDFIFNPASYLHTDNDNHC